MYALLQEDFEQAGRISIEQYNEEPAEAEWEFAEVNSLAMQHWKTH